MKKAIITGFEPFGPYAYNPTMDLAKRYNNKVLQDIELHGLVLPCTYKGAFEFLSDKINELAPDIIISSGLSSAVKGIRLELVGKNIMNGKYADANGMQPNNEQIITRDKLYYFTTSNNLLLADRLNESGISSEISTNADGFICNSLIYLTSRKIREENLPIAFTFFHTPWTRNYLHKIKLESGKIAIKETHLNKTTEILLTELSKIYPAKIDRTPSF